MQIKKFLRESLMKFQPLCRQCVQKMIQKYMDEVDTSLLSQIMHHQVKVIKVHSPFDKRWFVEQTPQLHYRTEMQFSGKPKRGSMGKRPYKPLDGLMRWPSCPNSHRALIRSQRKEFNARSQLHDCESRSIPRNCICNRAENKWC